MAINDRIRYAIASFGGKPFSTTELRDIFSDRYLTVTLREMVDAKEIVHSGRVRRFKAWVDMWQEVELSYDVKGYAPKKETERQAAELPGWRAVYPFLFTDPKLEGKRSVMHKGEM